MRHTLFIFSFLFLGFSAKADQQDIYSFFDEADALFGKYTTEGYVDYTALKLNPAPLNSLVSQIADMDLSSADAKTRQSFYINAYNITTIKAVVDNYPIDSPMDVSGFFDTKKHKIAGEMLTLNDIENKKLRANYDDSRFHFVLVCAAQGCPKIFSKSFIPAKLDAHLGTRTTEALNDANFIRVDKVKRRVLISEIFKWYKEDFDKTGLTEIQYINQFRSNKIPESYGVDYYSYDWTLNDKKKVR